MAAVTTWVDGALYPDDAATVSAFDHGLTVGDGCFETVKVIDRVPFALRRHLERLARSARGLDLAEPSANEVQKACAAVLSAPDTPRCARLRITWTGGPAPLGSERGAAHPTLVVAAAALPDRSDTESVVVAPWPHNERGALSGLKTTSYADNVVALAWARQHGAGEALLGNTRDELCEGTGSNVFVVFRERLVTPPLSSGALAGVTRALVLEWCAAEEAEIPLEALAGASELFLTSTTRDVQAVGRLNGTPMPDAPGPLTREVAAVFARRSAADPEP